MEHKINLPENLFEITLGDYQKFNAIEEKSQDPHFLATKMIEIFCKVDSRLVLQMKATDVNEIIEHLNGIFEEQHQLVKKFVMNGTEYGFIPDLNDLEFAAYVDIDTYINDIESLHVAMNALYRPIKDKYGERYNVEKYSSENPDKFKDMPLAIATSAMVFFYNLGMELSQVILTSLESKEQENLVQYLNSQANGGGINQSINSLKEILETLKISMN